jgi:mono/diheme cytochrome c family protein
LSGLSTGIAAKERDSGNDPEVVKGQKIAVGSCSTCHHLGKAGLRTDDENHGGDWPYSRACDLHDGQRTRQT